MDDRIENLHLEDFSNLARPEDALWDEEEAPSLIMPEAVIESDKGFSLPGLPGLSGLSGLKNKLKKPKIIKQEPQADGTPADPFARQLRELTENEVTALKQKVRNQPTIYEQVQKVERRGEVSRAFGMFLGLAFALWFIVQNTLAENSFLERLKELGPGETPSIIDKAIPDTIKTTIANQLNSISPDFIEGAHIAFAALLPILFIFAFGILTTLALRILLIRRIALAIPLLIALLAAMKAWGAITTTDINAWSSVPIIIALLLLIKPSEKLATWLLEKLRKAGGFRG